jgi:hypothetical protein
MASTADPEERLTPGGDRIQKPSTVQAAGDATQPGGDGTGGRPAPPASGRILSEFERLLGIDVCPACSYVVEAERSFFSWFAIESHTVAEMQAELRAAMGMCPAHSRRLVEQLGEGPIMTIVMREALTGARQRVRGEIDTGACPACASVTTAADDAARTVVDALARSSNARSYREHDGVCLPHLLDAAAKADAATLTLLAERLHQSLQASSDARLDGLLGGIDHDAVRRAGSYGRLPDLPAGASTVERLIELLAIDTCPVCLAAGHGELRYLRWLLQAGRDRDPSLRNDPGELCAAHLHDAALLDRAAADPAIERKRAVTMAGLADLVRRLAETPRASGRRRRAEPAFAETAHDALISPHQCPACRAGTAVERSQVELLTAGLSLAPVRASYERGHGLCVRHALALGEGTAGAFAKRHVDARLGVLAWEVHETARKYAWASRHESTGPEHDAWRRALAQIDARVFAGGPAVDAEPAAEEVA